MPDPVRPVLRVPQHRTGRSFNPVRFSHFPFSGSYRYPDRRRRYLSAYRHGIRTGLHPSDPVSVLLRNSGTPRHGAWSDDRRRMYQRRSGLRLHRSHAHGDRRSRSGDRHRSVHPGCSRCSVLPVHKKRTPLHPLRILSERNGKGSVQRVLRNGDRAVHCHYNLLI